MKSSVKTAVILAAGRGSRLGTMTDELSKCLVPVNGITLLERLLTQLISTGIEHCIIVVGYKADKIKEVVSGFKGLTIQFVHNDDWEVTNNIVSLQKAIPFIKTDFMLLESDLILCDEALIPFQKVNRMAIDKFLPFMNGTVVEMNDQFDVTKFFLSKLASYPKNPCDYYKTVNIYSFSLDDFNRLIYPEMLSLIESGKVNEYYELAFAKAMESTDLNIKAVLFEAYHWAEIDTPEDLEYAEKLFNNTKKLVT
jgi:choline kinase